ncbi:sensor histidine kinase [Variimorphobacter saccharofermentans]|nr:histidine kinase [Variimorphobacter saccharofermentans]
MMKSIPIMPRVILFLSIQTAFNLLWIMGSHNNIPEGLPYTIIGVVLNIIFLFLYYLFVIRSINLNNRLYHLFVEGKIYEELFKENIPFTAQSALVMNKFYQLLDKQDAINLSMKQAEYLALQNQINPHFLYNTLEAIRGDAIYAGVTSIAETTEALSSFFRYTITEVKALVTLADELQNAENYFKIQQYRFDDKIKMNIRFPENEENVTLLRLPKLTLQPIIENAVFHGLEGKVEGGCITIEIETTNKSLLITVSDNGLGIPPQTLSRLNASLEEAAIPTTHEEIKSKGGIALRNVSQRIKLLFGEDYGIHVYSTLGFGADVHITLPKIME